MPKIRELSQAEKFYVEHNIDKTDTQLASVMPGVGPKTVAKFRSELPIESKQEISTADKEETPEERVSRLSNGPTAGELMGRRSEDGVVVMTEAASEVADAKKTSHGNTMTEKEYKHNNRNRIHTIDPNRPTR